MSLIEGILTDFITYLLFGISIGGIYALMAVGLTLVLGVMDVVNFAHGEFVMLGGFVCFWLTFLFGLPYIPSLVLAFLIVGTLSMGIERTVFKPIYGQPILTSILVSIGLLILIENVALFVWGGLERFIEEPFGGVILRLGSIFISLTRVFAIVVSIVFFTFLWLFLHKTKMGKAIRATSQNREGALIRGIDIYKVSTITFFIGGGMAAAAGAVYGAIYSLYPTMGLLLILKSLAIIIIGGMGSVYGSLVAGLLAGILESVITGFVPALHPYRDAITFLFLVIVLLTRPRGLFGEW